MGIEYATDGAISDGISDGLLGLVGEEESYKAAQAFDDGEYISGAGHMIAGAAETIGDGAAELAGDAYEAAGDAYEAASDWIENVDLNPFD
jgi:hypothetical protein